MKFLNAKYSEVGGPSDWTQSTKQISAVFKLPDGPPESLPKVRESTFASISKQIDARNYSPKFDVTEVQQKAIIDFKKSPVVKSIFDLPQELHSSVESPSSLLTINKQASKKRLVYKKPSFD